MSRPTPRPESGTACRRCLRRAWLLSELVVPLDFLARDRGRLLDALALDDAALIDALGGRRKETLRASHRRLDAGQLTRAADVETICRHDRSYPRALAGAAGPRMLNIAGSRARLLELTAVPTVALVGSTRPSDYGIEAARGLARALAASGVTVLAGVSDGIAAAAHAGVLDADAGSLAVLGGGLGVATPARWRGLCRRVAERGAVVSELPCECQARRWGALAGERIIAALAQLTVVIEAEDSPGDLACARLATACGRMTGALPGRVTSALSQGPHALLKDGAELLRGAEDVLELLSLNDRPRPALGGGHADARLEPRLRETLRLLGGGLDTPGRLCRAGADPGDVLLALSQLELLGLVRRGDGGRYLPSISDDTA